MSHLGYVDAAPEQLEVLAHLGGLVLGVEDGELREHAHVRALQPQGCLQQADQLVEVSAVLRTTYANVKKNSIVKDSIPYNHASSMLLSYSILPSLRCVSA